MAGATHSVTLDGLMGRSIEVEADISGGLPRTVIVGLADVMVSEARDRCRSAITNSGRAWPDQRVTINLAPSTLPKSGSHYDLAIALAVLAAQDTVPSAALKGAVFLGELALDGRLRAIRGVLPATLAAAEAGFDRVFVPEVNVGEAELIESITVVGVRSLRQTVALLTGEEEPDDPPVPPLEDVAGASWTAADRLSDLDMLDVAGQHDARLAVVMAAAGGHHLLMTGPPVFGYNSHMSVPSRRAVIYVRQSKAKKDSISEEVQLAATREHCARSGYEVVDIVTEIGVSGYGDWRKRPKFPAMVSEIERGRYDVLVIYRWSRLSRRAADALNLWNMLEYAGVNIESAAENMDTSGAAGALSAKQMLLFAEFESRLKSEQFKEAHARRVSKGLPRDGHKRFGYDYVSAKHVINDEQAETIRMAFSAFMAGNSMLAVTDMLNESGRTTAAGKQFSVNTIFRVLDTGFPFGMLSLDGGKRWETGAHEAVLTADDWDEYRAERVRRSTGTREKPTRDMHELARIGVCGKCGAALVFRNRDRGYLVCSTHNQARGRCEGVNVKENELWLAFQTALGDPGSESHGLLHEAIHEATAGMDDDYRQAKRDRDVIKREVSDVETELGRLASGWATGVLDETGYKNANQAASVRLSEARERLAEAESVVLTKRPLEGIERLNSLVDMTTAETNALYRRAVKEIRFLDDSMICIPGKGESFTMTREAPRQKYPLNEWLDGGVHVLTSGEDFTTSIKAMRQTLRGAAKRRGMTIKCETTKSGDLRITPVGA